jgi:hypothetical protein
MRYSSPCPAPLFLRLRIRPATLPSLPSCSRAAQILRRPCLKILPQAINHAYQAASVQFPSIHISSPHTPFTHNPDTLQTPPITLLWWSQSATSPLWVEELSFGIYYRQKDTQRASGLSPFSRYHTFPIERPAIWHPFILSTLSSPSRPLLESGSNLWSQVIRGFENRPPTVLAVCTFFFVLLFWLLLLLSEPAKCLPIVNTILAM